MEGALVRFRRSASLLTAALFLVTVLVMVDHGRPAGAASFPAPSWTATTGDIHFSSPTIADVNGDGVKDVVIGGLDGMGHVLDGRSGSDLSGWPQPVVPPRSTTPTAIEAAPT